MSVKSIIVNIDTKDILEKLKRRLNFTSLNKLLYEMSFFIYENKVDITSSYHLSNERDKMNELKRYIDLKFKKQQDGEQSLRKFIGKLEHEYLLPTFLKVESMYTNNSDSMQEVFDENMEDIESKIDSLNKTIERQKEEIKVLNDRIEFKDREFEEWRIYELKFKDLMTYIKEENSTFSGKKVTIDISVEDFKRFKDVQ